MRIDSRSLDLDGDMVAAVFHEPDEGYDGTVVFCHGFGSDKAGSYERRAEQAVENGFRAVRFDFRGNNESSLDFDEANLTTRIADLQRVLDELDGAIGVYGSSFGGLVALHTAARDGRIDALALRAPVTFLSVLDDIREAIEEDGFYEQLPGKQVDERFLTDLATYSTEEIIDDITVPTLFLHGTEDDAVPIASSERFFGELSCRSRFITFEGEGHRFSDEADRQAVDAACGWFRDCWQ